MACPVSTPAVAVDNTAPIQMGVMNTPARLETEALKIAAGTFPRAIDTITTEDDTVEGKAARKNVPTQNNDSHVPPTVTLASKTTAGNTKNVTT